MRFANPPIVRSERQIVTSRGGDDQPIGRIAVHRRHAIEFEDDRRIDGKDPHDIWKRRLEQPGFERNV